MAGSSPAAAPMRWPDPDGDWFTLLTPVQHPPLRP
jgi:hypothetical protein